MEKQELKDSGLTRSFLIRSQKSHIASSWTCFNTSLCKFLKGFIYIFFLNFLPSFHYNLYIAVCFVFVIHYDKNLHVHFATNILFCTKKSWENVQCYLLKLYLHNGSQLSLMSHMRGVYPLFLVCLCFIPQLQSKHLLIVLYHHGRLLGGHKQTESL